jgi:hypothetical protein
LLTQLLANPNPDDPLDAEIAREYQIDQPTFNQKALEFTLKYANEETVMSSSHDQVIQNYSRVNLKYILQKYKPVRKKKRLKM